MSNTLTSTHSRFAAVLLTVLAAFAILFASSAAFAQDAIERPVDAVTVTENAPEAAVPEGEEVGGYTPMAPTKGKGMPTAYEDDAIKSLTFQDQYSADGQYALWMHNTILLPIITVISLFVLALLLFVVVRFRRKANVEPSKTTHNTLIEVVWTLVPVLILLVIAIPSITLLARQYESPPENAVTIKATGYQWYWTYSYPDHGGIEVISNMLGKEEAAASGQPYQLAVDNRMVVPAGVPLRVQTTAADVIHSFAVPSLWFKIDAVPGRLNERMLVIDEPGVYYGQCSELCGARHAYMPITVEALPMDQFEAWVLEKGGALPGADEAGAGADAEGSSADEATNTEESAAGDTAEETA